MKLYCYTEKSFENFTAFIQQLYRQNVSLVSLRDGLRSQDSEQDNACAVIVCNGEEMFLSRLRDFCTETKTPVAVFLTEMVSDVCVAKLHQCSHTPLFCNLSLFHRYSTAYLRSRVHLQAVFADILPNEHTRTLLYENRVRFILSHHSVEARGIVCRTVERAYVLPQKEETLQKELATYRPPVTTYPFAPYSAILGDAVFGCNWKRNYSPSDGVYSLVCDQSEEYIEIRSDEDSTVENLIAALAQGFYPVIRLPAKHVPYLLTAWDPSNSSFVAYSAQAPCLWCREQVSYQAFTERLSCTYLRPVEAKKPDPISFLKETCLASLSVANAYLQDFYRRDTFGHKELSSLATFLEERRMLCELMYRDGTEKGLYLPSVEEHLSLVERYVSPILVSIEQGRDPIAAHNRLLIVDGLSMVLLSEERCIEAYLEETERQIRDAAWVDLFRKKGDKR